MHLADGTKVYVERDHGRFVAKTETANNTEFIDTWQVKDPLAVKYFSSSPYAFCGNNPVNLVDPDGKRQWQISKKVILYQKAIFLEQLEALEMGQ